MARMIPTGIKQGEHTAFLFKFSYGEDKDGDHENGDGRG